MRLFRRTALVIVTFGILVVIAGRANAQAQLEWLFRRDAGPVGYAGVSAATSDSAGNVYLGVQTFSANVYPSDIEVVKLSPSGAPIWVRSFNTGPFNSERAAAIALAPNGDVCVAGLVFDPIQELIALRYDSNGTLLWQEVLPDAGSYKFALDASGNMIVGGWSYVGNKSDMLVRSYSPSGQLLWEQRIDGPQHGNDYAYDLVVDAAGDIFVAGPVNDFGMLKYDSAIAKLSSSGQLLWLSVLPSSPTLRETLRFITSDGHGGVVAVGSADALIGATAWPNGIVARCDGSGAYLWDKRYPDAGGAEIDAAYDVLVDATGTTWALINADELGTPRIVMRRYAENGATLSTFTYTGSGSATGQLLQGNAGQVFMCGTTGSKHGSTSDVALLTQFDVEGRADWTRLFSSPGIGLRTTGIAAAPNARVVLVGSTYESGSSDALALQIDVSESPHGYCTAKVNSLGCIPQSTFVGLSSASATAGFELRVEQVRNQKSGLFLYGVSGPASTPFGGGVLCVAPPVRRTPGQSSGGTPAPASDCSGLYALDMNAFAQGLAGGNPLPALLVPGTAVHTQAWGRDPGFAPPDNVTLSAGLSYVVLP